jgi:hypothetical protein
VKVFEHFTSNVWIFESVAMDEMAKNLSNSENQTFNFQFGHINWLNYFTLYCFGIQKYILKQENEIDPENWHEKVLAKNYDTYFDDIYWVYSRSNTLKRRDNGAVYKEIFNSELLQNTIIAHQKKNPKQNTIKKVHLFMKELMSTYNTYYVGGLMYIIHKVLNKYFEQIEVTEQSI